MGLLSRLTNRGKDLLFLPPLDGFWRRRLRGRVLCLLYHRVEEPGVEPFLDAYGVPPIPPRHLEEELAFLQRQGARFLTFADLREGRFPGPDDFGVIVSFDDGFRDNYRTGLPVLEHLQVSGVVFQSSAMVDAPTLLWEHSLYWFWHQEAHRSALSALAHRLLPASRPFTGIPLLAHLREATPIPQVEALLASYREEAGEGTREALAAAASRLYPTAGALQSARAAGHEIGSHGHRHYPRRSLSREAFDAELQQSRQALAAVIGEPPAAFSYPFNSYLPDDPPLCGLYYQQVATVDARCIERHTPPLALPRFTWPGPHRSPLHWRRWLWTGTL